MPSDSSSLRNTLERMGLNPEAVDLDWTARIARQTEEIISALRSEPGFSSAEPLYQPERQPRRSSGS